MTKKNWLFIGLAVVLAAVYVVYFTDWFKPKTVQIFHTTRAPRVRALPNGKTPPPMLLFGLNQQLRLTKIMVVPVAALETNSHALPIWYMISDSNSVPVKSFFYGQNIRGLKPYLSTTRAQPLETNVTYRLLVEAGSVKGQHDFKLE
jgi:hypothetical protein